MPDSTSPLPQGLPTEVHIFHHYPDGLPGTGSITANKQEAPLTHSSAITGTLKSLLHKDITRQSIAPEVLEWEQETAKQALFEDKSDTHRATASKNKQIVEPMESFQRETPETKTAKPMEEKKVEEVEEDEILCQKPESKSVIDSPKGLLITLFGSVIPLATISAIIASCPKRLTLVLLNHPLETACEIALICLIPTINYLIWKGMRNDNLHFSIGKNLALGSAIATSLCFAVVSLAAIPAGMEQLNENIGTTFATGFVAIGFILFLAAATSLYLAGTVYRSRLFDSSKRLTALRLIAGAMLGLILIMACETRSFVVRQAMAKAMSNQEKDFHQSREILRALNCERELRMECSDSRSAGLAGLFIPVKTTDLKGLYFSVVGKPFQGESENELANLSEEYRSRHIIGSSIKGLHLARSFVEGTIHQQTLTSTMVWTLVLKNDTSTPQEARAELALPPQAVITSLALWKNGEKQTATIAATGKSSVADAINLSHQSPATISQIARGRYLFHCYPIPEDQQLKVEITTVIPLRMEGEETANLILPRFTDSNFALDGEHLLSLEADGALSTKAVTPCNISSDKRKLNGNLELKDHSPVLINIKLEPQSQAHEVIAFDGKATKEAHLAALQKLAREKEALAQEQEAQPQQQQLVLMLDGSKAVKQQIEDAQSAISKKKSANKSKATPPRAIPLYLKQATTITAQTEKKQIYIVLDGSWEIKGKIAQIIKGLQAAPKDLPIFLSLASSEEDKLKTSVPLAQALPQLEKLKYSGGQDNLQAVVQAVTRAQENKGSVLLWIHGPQPALSKEIYIMNSQAHKAKLYDLPVDSSETDTMAYFKNHSEIGLFQPVMKGQDLASDIQDFLQLFASNHQERQIKYTLVKNVKASEHLTPEINREIIILGAAQRVEDLLHKCQWLKAARLAHEYGLVSPVSCATIVEQNLGTTPEMPPEATSSDEIQANQENQEQAPNLAEIQGVNTAGTVRVNNLANLEAMLNIICNMVELLAMIAGVLISIRAFLPHSNRSLIPGLGEHLNRTQLLALGVGLIFLGCSFPGIVNWFVASARDAALFN
jgi:hypothetical protein